MAPLPGAAGVLAKVSGDSVAGMDLDGFGDVGVVLWVGDLHPGPRLSNEKRPSASTLLPLFPVKN